MNIGICRFNNFWRIYPIYISKTWTYTTILYSVISQGNLTTLTTLQKDYLIRKMSGLKQNNHKNLINFLILKLVFNI